MAIKGYFFNAVKNALGVYDRQYNAQDVTDYLDLIVGSGVFPTPSTNLQVVAGSGMNITVNPGQGWINGHKIINTADLPLTVSGSDILLDRIDRVIFYVDYTTRSMGIEILEGTPAASPVAPTLTRNETRIEYCLATIAINKQVTSITQANITDTRADSTVCGWVAGLIQQVDTSELFAQWEDAYTSYYATIQNQLNDFMETLTETLQVKTYIKEFTKFVQVTSSDSKIIPLDMENYTYEESDILIVALNGLLAAPTVDYLLDTRSTPPELHVNLVGSTNTTDDIDIRVLKSVVGIAAAANNSENQTNGTLSTNEGDNVSTSGNTDVSL